MIRENIIEIRERIVKACVASGRSSSEVTLIVITKNRQPEEVLEAIESGVTDIGENRVQEAMRKFSGLQQVINDKQIKRHFVGHLQTNKIKEALRLFDLIHSVDSVKLAAEIDRQAQRMSQSQDILVQINTSFEESKSGFTPQDAIEAVLEIAKFKNIKIRGLMTMAPVVKNPQEAGVFFKNLRDIRDKINSLALTPYPITHLSMGMSDDFEIAVQEGSTMVRLGRVVFGEQL